LDGAIVEVHPDPASALSDAEQALDFTAFERLMRRLKALLSATEPSNIALAACR
jgi:3-deoxy-D-arabino-heptulosonate 7-phosphate (DAHP) synthase